MKQEKSKFELLRSKSIIAILDGDKDFGPLIINGVDSGIKISMPYLSGPMLCTISNNWGLPATYDRNGGAKSRWEYLDDLLAHCIRNNRGSDLLAFLFSKQQFEDKLKDRTAKEIESAYKQIVTTIIDQINGEHANDIFLPVKCPDLAQQRIGKHHLFLIALNGKIDMIRQCQVNIMI